MKGLVLNTRDVSERKAFEEQLRTRRSTTRSRASRTAPCSRTVSSTRSSARIRDDRAGRRSCSWTSTTSRRSTTRSATRPATACWPRSATALKNSLRAADTAARLGGDEFAILLEDGGEGLGAADVAARILESLDGAVPRSRARRSSSARASASRRPTRATSGYGGAEELLRNADVAMYMAKESGKNRYQIFEPAMHDTALKRLELKADLQRALDNAEFILHYQPVIELETGAISGRRGPGPLAAPAARHRPAARLHPARRGDRPHRADRELGPAGGDAPGQAAPGPLSRDAAAPHGREPVGSPARSGPRSWTTSREALMRSGLAAEDLGPGDHREHHDAGHRAVACSGSPS